MAFGDKTNERPGVRSHVRHARVSAYKAREVLDLIRGEPYGRASEILEFSERGVSRIIKKCLDSAIANAENNAGLPAEELFVSACYADEGPTLKRWRPRARGRAMRIRKRTCHITVIVSRYTPEQLTRLRTADTQSGRVRTSSGAADARRRRVERSRALETQRRVAEEAAEQEHDHDHEGHDHEGHEGHDHEGHDHEDHDDDAVDLDETGPYGPGSAEPLEDGSAPEGYDIKGNEDSMLYHVPASRNYGATVAEVYFATAEDAESAGFAAPGSASKAETGPYGPGSAEPLEDGSAPEGYDIKGNEDSMIYHVPGSRYYGATVAEVYFATAEDAESAGFAAPGSASEGDTDGDDAEEGAE
jgi:large subunit ribosomal protein L22